MKRTICSVALVIAAAAVASAQEYRPMPGPPMTTSLETTLRRAGNFNVFLSLLERADLKALGVAVFDGRTNPAAAGPGGGPRYQTIFVPNDSGFARLPLGTVEALRRNPARLRSFLLAHLVQGEVSIRDMPLQITDGSSRATNLLKTRQGTVLTFKPSALKGVQSPEINGRARVGRLRNTTTSDYVLVVHEVDAVLFGDGSV